MTIGQDLEGLTLGILGLGKLGQRVAGVAKAFGMKVIAWSQNLTPEKAKEAGVDYASKEDLFRKADIVTIHYQLGERSRGLITADDIGRMKPSAYLINTARAPIVDQAALLKALQDKKIAGAGLDVFEVEPLPLDHPVPQAGQCRDHAASRLCQRAELPQIFSRHRRGHPRLAGRQAGKGRKTQATNAVPARPNASGPPPNPAARRPRAAGHWRARARPPEGYGVLLPAAVVWMRGARQPQAIAVQGLRNVRSRLRKSRR